jgi:hypothetical protein
MSYKVQGLYSSTALVFNSEQFHVSLKLCGSSLELFFILTVIISIKTFHGGDAGMIKKRIIVGVLIIAVILSILMIYRYSQYIFAWQANQHINVNGIKLMMTENKVRSLIGKEEEYIPGFGGYGLEYQSKGVFITFLDDRDTDFYRKVNKIKITNSKYEIFDVKVGDEFEKALKVIRKHGFTQQKDGLPGYWKMNMYIVLDRNYNEVKEITIGIRDRVSSSRVY